MKGKSEPLKRTEQSLVDEIGLQLQYEGCQRSKIKELTLAIATPPHWRQRGHRYYSRNYSGGTMLENRQSESGTGTKVIDKQIRQGIRRLCLPEWPH